MTKPDFNTSKPKTQEQAAQAAPPETTVDDKKDTKKQNKPQERRIEDIMAAIGMDVCSDNNDLPGPRHIGMEWAFILRVANTQAVLSVLSIVCLSSSMLLTGFNFYRFTSSAWATYLLSCAYIGMRAGRWQSYAHVVAFCGMCTFQTLIYMSTMCWLVYSVYALDAHSQIYDPVRRNAADAVLLLTLGEVLSMMGTVLTGVLGLIGCCRGFGRLLHAQEKMIMLFDDNFESTYLGQQLACCADPCRPDWPPSTGTHHGALIASFLYEAFQKDRFPQYHPKMT